MGGAASVPERVDKSTAAQLAGASWSSELEAQFDAIAAGAATIGREQLLSVQPAAPAAAVSAPAPEAAAAGASDGDGITQVRDGDPWRDLDTEAAWKLLQDDDVPVLELLSQDAVASAASEPGPPPAATAEEARHIKAEGADLDEFVLAPSLRRVGVALDLSQNALEAFSLGASEEGEHPACFLRHLSLSGNPLSEPPTFTQCAPTLLLSLDVSFIECEWRAAFFAALPCLRKLQMECCGLVSLLDTEAEGDAAAPVPLFGTLSQLQQLHVGDNEIGDEALEDGSLAAGLAPLRSLHILDLRENEVCDNSREFRACVLGALPALRELNNQFLKQESSVANMAQLGEDMRERNLKTNDLFANQDDKSSCSCLEGNPCIDPNCCKDWKNREAVAARVRNEYAKFSRGVEHDATLAKGFKQLGIGVRDLAAEQQLNRQWIDESKAKLGQRIGDPTEGCGY